MLNADTDSMYTVPTFGMNKPEQQYLSAREIEQSVIPQYVRDNTIDLGYEEVPQASYWGVKEANHDTMPQSVVEEAGYQRVPDAAAEIDALSAEASAAYVNKLGHTLAGVRREALTLAA